MARNARPHTTILYQGLGLPLGAPVSGGYGIGELGLVFACEFEVLGKALGEWDSRAGCVQVTVGLGFRVWGLGFIGFGV